MRHQWVKIVASWVGCCFVSEVMHDVNFVLLKRSLFTV